MSFADPPPTYLPHGPKHYPNAIMVNIALATLGSVSGNFCGAISAKSPQDLQKLVGYLMGGHPCNL